MGILNAHYQPEPLEPVRVFRLPLILWCILHLAVGGVLAGVHEAGHAERNLVALSEAGEAPAKAPKHPGEKKAHDDCAVCHVSVRALDVPPRETLAPIAYEARVRAPADVALAPGAPSALRSPAPRGPPSV